MILEKDWIDWKNGLRKGLKLTKYVNKNER